MLDGALRLEQPGHATKPIDPIAKHSPKWLAENLFELKIRDEFLPIYTNTLYPKVVNDNSVLVEMSPERSAKKTRNGLAQSIVHSTYGHQSSVVHVPGTPYRTQASIIERHSTLVRPQNHSISRVTDIVGTGSLLKPSVIFEA